MTSDSAIMDTYIKGNNRFGGSVVVGMTFDLIREPENATDRNAVMVMKHNQKFGYVAKADAQILSPIIESGGEGTIYGVVERGSSSVHNIHMMVRRKTADE